MKIGIVSDTHGCVETWRYLFNNYFQDADLIIHAGDVLYHGPRNTIPAEYNPKELAAELNICPIPVIIAQGNCDAEVDSMVLEIPITKSSLIQYEGLRIWVQHGHDLSEEQAAMLGRRYKLDVVITGHTHIPELRRSQETILINPGSPGMTKREDGQGTFAVLSDQSIAIYNVRTGAVITELSLI
jgi:hypothetical protein